MPASSMSRERRRSRESGRLAVLLELWLAVRLAETLALRLDVGEQGAEPLEMESCAAERGRRRSVGFEPSAPSIGAACPSPYHRFLPFGVNKPPRNPEALGRSRRGGMGGAGAMGGMEIGPGATDAEYWGDRRCLTLPRASGDLLGRTLGTRVPATIRGDRLLRGTTFLCGRQRRHTMHAASRRNSRATPAGMTMARSNVLGASGNWTFGSVPVGSARCACGDGGGGGTAPRRPPAMASKIPVSHWLSSVPRVQEPGTPGRMLSRHCQTVHAGWSQQRCLHVPSWRAKESSCIPWHASS